MTVNPILTDSLERWDRRRREIPAFGNMKVKLNSPVSIPIGTIVMQDPANPGSVKPVTVPYTFALGCMISPDEVLLTGFYCQEANK